MRRNGHKVLPPRLAILAESFSIDPSDEKVLNSVLCDLLLKLNRPYLFRSSCSGTACSGTACDELIGSAIYFKVNVTLIAGMLAVRSTIVATYVNPAAILLVFTCSCQLLPESTKVGAPPELPATMMGIATGAGVMPPEEG